MASRKNAFLCIGVWCRVTGPLPGVKKASWLFTIILHEDV